MRVAAEAAGEGAPARPPVPAALRRYVDLARSRHGYPLVLRDRVPVAEAVQPLWRRFEEAVATVAVGADSDTAWRRESRALERALRAERCDAVGTAELGACVAALRPGLLAGAESDGAETRRGRLETLAAALGGGRLLGCGRGSAALAVRHLFEVHETARAEAISAELTSLHGTLQGILRADFAASAEACTASALRASLGSGADGEIDLERMAAVAARRPRGPGLPLRRAERIRGACKVLEGQRVFPVGNVRPPRGSGLVYESGRDALRAFSQLRPERAALARAVATARLEVAGGYDERIHDAFFAGLDDAALLRLEPDCTPALLVCLEPERFEAGEQAILPEILASELPIRVLVCHEALLAETPAGGLVLGAWTGRLAALATGLGCAHVVQASLAMLPDVVEAMARAFAAPGPALFSVFTGSPANSSLPAYLETAAADEARLFPSYAFDPSLPARRLTLRAGPEDRADWPLLPLHYEDADLQGVREDWPLTPLDVLAADSRFGDHFRTLAPSQWSDALEPAGCWLGRDSSEAASRTPYLWLSAEEDVLVRVVPDETVLEAARSCARQWSHLRALAAWAAPAAASPATTPSPAVETPEPAARAIPAAPRGDGAPWIETRRCTSCDECVQRFPHLFVYDGNHQAVLQDPAAGAFREWVEAAEACKMAIIHPGAPRDASEPGLEALLARAEAFR